MSAFSILFPPDGEPYESSADQDVDLLFDLNLDQIIAAVTLGKEEYDLAPVFGAPLRNVDEVRYRQEVMRDLEDTVTSAAIKDFAGSVRKIRQSLGLVEKLYYDSQ